MRLSLRLDPEVETFGLLLLCLCCGSIPLLVPYSLTEPDDVPSPLNNKGVFCLLSEEIGVDLIYLPVT